MRPDIRCTAFTFAPADTANDAAVCRRSCGVIVGNSGVVVVPGAVAVRVAAASRAGSSKLGCAYAGDKAIFAGRGMLFGATGLFVGV